MTGVVFLLVDQGRRSLYDHIKMKPKIKLLIETGMATYSGLCVSINPLNYNHLQWFEENRLPHVDTEEEKSDEGPSANITSACGSSQVVKIMSQSLAAIAVNQYMRWAHNNDDIGIKFFMSLRPVRAYETKITE
jgi:hypothetical protein